MKKYKSLRKYLADEFEIKGLESLKYFLGIKVARLRHGIFISQRKCRKLENNSYCLDLSHKVT